MAGILQRIAAMAGFRPAQAAAPRPPAGRGRAWRKFEAAAVDRLTNSWMATQASIDRELRGDLARLRARSRDMAKNNEYMAKYLRMVRNNVIGQGMTLQSRPMDGRRMDTMAAQAIERHWAAWCRPDQCDVTGRAGFWTLLRAASDALVRDGELLLRLRPGRGDYGLQLQLLDVNRIDITLNVERAPNRNAIVMGVELDDFHRPVAYHIARTLPDEAGTRRLSGDPVERVPASEIVHRFMPLEPEQTRGVPWAHAAMRRLHDLGGYREAAVIAARIGASKMGFYTTPEPDALKDGDDDDGVPYTSATPGEFGVLPPGVSFQTFDPAYPHEQFGDFVKAALRGIASGLGVSYNTLANDLEGVNFSSIRSGVLEERDEWMVMQDWWIEQVLDPIFGRWLDIALASQRITMAGTGGTVALPAAKREKFAEHVWMPRRWSWVDPLKDVQAKVLEIENGLTTVSDVAAAMGRDVEDILAAKARERELAAQYGVELVSAPAASAGAGMAEPDADDSPDDAAARMLQPLMQAVRAQAESASTLMAGVREVAGRPIHVNVTPPAQHIDVRAPEVNVEAVMPAPEVHVAAAEVRAPEVQVTVAAPVVNVAAPEVTVEAVMPPAEITVQMPARQSTTTVRRESGRIVETTTVERDA